MKTNLLYIGFLCVMLCCNCAVLSAQSTIDLDQVLSSVIADSYAITSAKNQKEIARASYDFYKALLKPTIGLSATIPNFSKTSAPVIQPDGTISFTSIRQANSSVSLFATQVLASTGGTLFLNSDLQRFDDLSLVRLCEFLPRTSLLSHSPLLPLENKYINYASQCSFIWKVGVSPKCVYREFSVFISLDPF